MNKESPLKPEKEKPEGTAENKNAEPNNYQPEPKPTFPEEKKNNRKKITRKPNRNAELEKNPFTSLSKKRPADDIATTEDP